jgi:hypothetical protein
MGCCGRNNGFRGSLYCERCEWQVPSNSHFICSRVLHHTNHSIVARFATLKVLWPTGVHEEKVLILYSDAAACMRKAATALRVFYPNLINFTCMAHGLQRVAEEFIAKFPKVNKLISMTKKVFLKAPHQGSPCPPNHCQQD